RGRRVLLGDVLRAVRAALRILVNLPLAVRAGDRRLTVLTQSVINCFVSVPALAVILPVLVFRDATGHSNLPLNSPTLRERLPDWLNRHCTTSGRTLRGCGHRSAGTPPRAGQ